VVADLSYTPESQSEARHPNPHHQPCGSHTRSTNSIHSHSIDEAHLAAPHKNPISRYRSPSPNTHINQLRKVLAGDRIPRRSHDEAIPKIEVNGEKVETPSSTYTPPLLEKEEGEVAGVAGAADVTSILESLKGKGIEVGNVEKVGEKVGGDGGVMSPPYGI